MKKLLILLLTVSALFGQFKFQKCLPDRYTSLLVKYDNNPNVSPKDISQYNNVLTTYGGVTTTSTNPPKFGVYSGYFDGSNDYVTTPSNVTHLNLGAENFTIDFMLLFYNTVINAGGIIEINNQSPGYCGVVIETSGSYATYTYGISGSNWELAKPSSALSQNVWYHIAIVRNGTNFKMYINGQENWSATVSGSVFYGGNYLLTIGSYYNGYAYGKFQIQNIRVRKGIAYWTNNFLPPNKPY